MLDQFDCPACHADDWEKIGTNQYKRDVKPKSDYLALRWRVLFELWLPNHDQVRLSTIMCRDCGFMTYTPRPSTTDIEAKYRFLQRAEGSLGTHHGSDSATRTLELRADMVYRAVRDIRSGSNLDVLDFGGGDGRLLSPFADAGHRCYLVDYNRLPREGIEKLGDTLEEVSDDQRFDVIICSHVLEHLADPFSHLEWFRTHLRAGGVIYGEVPLGVWEGIGIRRDPVTHINFFTPHSFGRLFARSGFEPLTLDQRVGWYTRRIDIVVAVARVAAETAQQIPGSVEQSRSLLRPSIYDRARRYMRLRRFPSPTRAIKRLVSRIGGSVHG